MLNHEELTQKLYTVPLTWLPDLLFRVVRLCVQQGVFQPGGLEAMVERAKQSAHEESDLRKATAEQRIAAED